jgi:thiol-disulfide isomerase/thioredoxin
MMRFFILLLGLFFLYIACNNNKSVSSKLPKSIQLEVRILDTLSELDTLRLYAWSAIQAEEINKVAFKSTGFGKTAVFSLGSTPSGMYYVGTSLSDLKPILMGTESSILLETNNSSISNLATKVSDLNIALDQLMERIQNQNQVYMGLVTAYSEAKSNKKKRAAVKDKMAIEDRIKRNLLDSLRQNNPELARIMAFNAFQSFQNNAQNGQSEGAYFANAYLKYIDFGDTIYARLPFYYENIKNYATALSKIGLPVIAQNAALDSMFLVVPDSSPNYKPTLVATMFGTMGKNNAAFKKYGKLYLEKFEGNYAMLDKFVRDKLVELRGAAGIGEEAINIVGDTPEGIKMDLKSLRGKYVLIDFWASWCGPCRRENPNVVRLYNQYKDKGFDILGVSLDNNKEKWKAAIKKDKLKWHHISDLKGWSSTLSKPYGVRGIPYTVLVDKEGKILAKKLRGAALEAKLKELFGS